MAAGQLQILMGYWLERLVPCHVAFSWRCSQHGSWLPSDWAIVLMGSNIWSDTWSFSSIIFIRRELISLVCSQLLGAEEDSRKEVPRGMAHCDASKEWNTSDALYNMQNDESVVMPNYYRGEWVWFSDKGKISYFSMAGLTKSQEIDIMRFESCLQTPPGSPTSAWPGSAEDEGWSISIALLVQPAIISHLDDCNSSLMAYCFSTHFL